MTELLCLQPAHELLRLLTIGELSASELLHAHLRQIEEVNPAVNAIVTLTAERAMAEARAVDEAFARGQTPLPLHGLPIVHKDLFATAGVRTTRGSPIFRDQVPTVDAPHVARIRAAGAVMLGKTNTPEFGAGSQTFNPVFGATRNPYDLSRTCGGSSGGAAVALACGLSPLADGSDVGGSLRNPAAFCNVVGIRPTEGRVTGTGWPGIGVTGALGRTVRDVGLLLSVMAGPDPRAPVALETPGAHFREPLGRDFRGVRLAWSPTLGGLPVEGAVSEVLARAVKAFAAIGVEVEEAEPQLAGADEVFAVLRAVMYEQRFGELLDAYRDQVKDTVAWNVEQGRALVGAQVARAHRLREGLAQEMASFFERYEFLLCPVTQVAPFSVDVPYPTEIEGWPMASYLEWMRSCTDISATGCPAISVPAGFTADGLPVGLQIVGRWRDDFGLLQIGGAYEQATGHWRQHPPIAFNGAAGSEGQ